MINEVDFDGKGVIEFPAFLKMMAKQVADLKAEDEIRETFKFFDQVSISYIFMLPYKNISKFIIVHFCEKKSIINQLFLQNGNGQITRHEFKSVLLNLGEKITDEECDLLVTEADLDGDGQVDYEEFYFLMVTSQGKKK